METEVLDDVLFEFRRENNVPTPEAVEAWAARYPRFAQEIRKAATMWAEMEMEALLNRPSDDDESLVMEARSAALNALHRASNQRTQSTAIGHEVRTLSDAVGATRLSVAELARQISLPATVLSQIVRGKIMGATIPETLTRMLAHLLGKEADWIRNCYPGGVMTAYETASRPPSGISSSEVTDLTFQEAIMDVSGLNEEQRLFWLEEV